MEKIIGLKHFRENLPYYSEKIKHGESFLVVKKSTPVFRISPYDEDDALWEEVVDFTKIKRGGVSVNDLLTRL